MSEDYHKLMSFNGSTAEEQLARNYSAINATVDDGDFFEDCPDDQPNPSSQTVEKPLIQGRGQDEEFFDAGETDDPELVAAANFSALPENLYESDNATPLPVTSRKRQSRSKMAPSPEALQVWEQGDLPDADRIMTTDPALLVGYCVSIKSHTKTKWRHGKVLEYNTDDKRHNVLLIAGHAGESAGTVWMNMRKQVCNCVCVCYLAGFCSQILVPFVVSMFSPPGVCSARCRRR
jgi:hypothetical protein